MPETPTPSIYRYLFIHRLIMPSSFPTTTPPGARNLQQIALDKGLAHGASQTGGRALDDDAGGLEGLDLGVGAALAAGNDGAGVAHAAARGRADAGDEADDGLAAVDGVVLAQEVGGVLLGRAADLADHDDAVRVLVLEEDLEAVDEVGPAEGVTANADDEGLAEAGLGGLVDGLVGQGAGTGDDADATALVDEAGHDADLALAGGDDAGAVGPDEAGLGLALQDIGDTHHVYARVSTTWRPGPGERGTYRAGECLR